MKHKTVIHIIKATVTCTACAAAGLFLWQLYLFYTYAPQTRDGRIRADAVPVASDVSGRVAAVFVHDNQPVKKGAPLFCIDKERLEAALAQADAALADARVKRDAALREYRRYQNLSETVVSGQQKDRLKSDADAARAHFQQMASNRTLARINLSRAKVVAPVNGIVTNLSLKKGVYAATGNPVMTLVDTDSFYVMGYFEETKLKNIHRGMKARIRVMGESKGLEGHVTGLSAGITDRDVTTASKTLLPNVNPTFKWVRLAQRIPVRIAIDKVPKALALVAGRTVSIALEQDPAPTGLGGQLTFQTRFHLL